MAPEVLIGDSVARISYTNKVDVWSLGILIYFLCCKKYPFIGIDAESTY